MYMIYKKGKFDEMLEGMREGGVCSFGGKMVSAQEWGIVGHLARQHYANNLV